WVHHYNHHRPHTGIKGKAPIERLRVHNLPTKNN
ncbi:IS481 family transposase, partial [Mycolicibacterium elephantis]|nr:IS481 family transposase [Mycolicibacterium elephantis]